jgi:hypothetical protein
MCDHKPNIKQLYQQKLKLYEFYKNKFGDYVYANCYHCKEFLEYIPTSWPVISLCPLCDQWICNRCAPQIFIDDNCLVCDCLSENTIECCNCSYHYCDDCKVASCVGCSEDALADNCPKCSKRFMVDDRILCDCCYDILAKF